MLKTKKSKQNVTILVLSVMLAIAAIFGVTAAWFVSSADASGTVSTGSVTVELYKGTTSIKGSTTAFSVSDAVAGDNILGKDGVSVKVTAKGTGVYLRAKITVDASSVTGGATKLTANDFTITKADDWSEPIGGYYYYGTSATALTEVDEAEVSKEGGKTIPLATGIELNKLSDAQNNTGVTVTIVVDAVQSDNQEAGKVVWTNGPAA